MFFRRFIQAVKHDLDCPVTFFEPPLNHSLRFLRRLRQMCT